jgi:hypothetical protein
MERAFVPFEASTYRVSFGNPVRYECRLLRRFEAFYARARANARQQLVADVESYAMFAPGRDATTGRSHVRHRGISNGG